MKLNNITGKRFNRLVAIKYVGNREWLFKCDCGREKIINSKNVRKGLTKSCGCLNSELASKRFKKHGMKFTRFYGIWEKMKKRCQNKNVPAYPLYGGRGIEIAKSWNNFIKFRNDMYQSYQQHILKFGEKQTTIERKNNNGNYCKENCRWATMQEQGRNKRNNHLINFNGQVKCLSEWADIFNIKSSTIRHRLKRKWSVKEAITKPLKVNVIVS